jgi:hypothetical protein
MLRIMKTMNQTGSQPVAAPYAQSGKILMLLSYFEVSFLVSLSGNYTIPGTDTSIQN